MPAALLRTVSILHRKSFPKCDNGGGGSKRQEVKTLLRRLKRDNPNIENSIFRSIHAVALDTMPGYKSEGVEHSFLERFNALEAASDENE